MFRVFLVFAVVLQGCASKRDYLGNGKKLFDNGMYTEALKEFELGTKKEPNNVDILIGLRKTQDKIYENELVKVRDTRAAGDPFKAIEKIRLIDKKMADWNIQSSINGSQFRKNELDRILSDLRKTLSDELEQGHILKVHQTLKSFQDVFGSLDSYQAYENEILSKGKEKCEQLKGNYKFFNIFISKYCEYFSVKHDVQIRLEDELYSVSDVKLLVDGKDITLTNYLGNSKLYHPNGKNILRSSGKVKINYSEKKSVQKKSHSYVGEEGYTAYEQQKYWVDEPYFVPEVKCNYSVVPASCYTKNVRYVKQVAKYKEVKVRKHRKVNKTHNYNVDQVEQFLRLKGESILKIGKLSVKMPHDFKESHVDTGHNINRNDIQLYPKKMVLRDVEDWKKNIIDRVGGHYRNEVEMRWILKYCRKEGDITQQGENMMRCAYIAAENNKFLNDWSLNFSGISYPEMKKLLKI